MKNVYIVSVLFCISMFPLAGFSETKETCYYSSTHTLQWVRTYSDKKELISAEFYCPDGAISGKYVKQNKEGQEVTLCGRNLKPSFPCGVSIHMGLKESCNPNEEKGFCCGDDWLN